MRRGKRRKRRRRISVYVFHQDEHCLFLGERLRPWLKGMRSEFVYIMVLSLAIEAALLVWPIVATVIWQARAFLTWIHFLYLPRIFLVSLALFQVRYPQRLWGTGDYTVGWNSVRLSGGFSAYKSMAWWVRVAMLHGVLLTLIFVLVTLGVIPVFLNGGKKWPWLLWALSLGFHLIVIAESLILPFAVWKLGVHRPTMAALRKAQLRGAEARPRRLREMARERDLKKRRASVAKLRL